MPVKAENYRAAGNTDNRIERTHTLFCAGYKCHATEHVNNTAKQLSVYTKRRIELYHLFFCGPKGMPTY